MDNEIKIRQLWRYLKIEDDEILIIQFYNQSTKAEEYAIAAKSNGEIEIRYEKDIPELSLNKPFHLFQHIGTEGKHIIPSVKELEEEKDMDY